MWDFFQCISPDECNKNVILCMLWTMVVWQLFCLRLFVMSSSADACLITVNMEVGASRPGRASVVPVMEQDTVELPATLVSLWMCEKLGQPSFIIVFFFLLSSLQRHYYVSLVCSYLIRPSALCLWLIKPLHNSLCGDSWTFEVFKRQACPITLCFVPVREKGIWLPKHQHTKKRSESV